MQLVRGLAYDAAWERLSASVCGTCCDKESLSYAWVVRLMAM